MTVRVLDRFSVRARLTLAVTTWTALALTVAGLALARVGDHRVMADATDVTRGVIADFREALERAPTSPATEVVTAFAQDAVLGPDVSAIAVVDMVPSSAPGAPAVRLLIATDAVGTVPDAADGGDSTVVERDGSTFGTSVLPVQDGDEQSYLVVVNDVGTDLEALDDLMVTYALIALAVLIVTGLSSWWIAGRILSPLRRLHRTAASISAGDLDRRVPVTGSDDISRLQQTVNSMLDRLETAFAAQRDLLDDVSHELRTPLTVMRGHLETARGADPATTAEVHAIVIEEIERTTRLVGDLGVLADARRPDFVQRGPTRLADLVDRIARKSTVLGERSWAHDAPPDLRVSVDAERVTQAVLQLVENAVGHTRRGDTISIRASVLADDTVAIDVEDTGSGIDPADRDVVFRRFGRGRADRSGAQGHGLGLTIVSAIAEAHGGTVTLLVSTPGVGSTFRLTLPGALT